MDENNEYTEIWLNDTEAQLPPDEIAVVAGQKQLMHDFVTGKDKSGLEKALKLEQALNQKRADSVIESTTKNGRSKR